jgi:hypothetical protein
MRIAGKLGLTPPRPEAVALKFGAFFSLPDLPKPPATFGHERLIADWGLLGNDAHSCCVFSGAAHETMMWTAERGEAAAFTDAGVLADYAAVTGFSPTNPASDRGADMQQAAAYRHKTGIVDGGGKRHLIDAYVDLEIGNLEELWAAVWLLGAVGVGYALPLSAQRQFETGERWTNVLSPVLGGHYVPAVGRNSKGDIVGVTWGRNQGIDPAFYEAHNICSIACLSLENLDEKGLSPEQFDKGRLEAMLREFEPAAGREGELVS